MYRQLYDILCNYLKTTGVSFSKNKLKQLLASHPESNSLFAMIDTLNEMNIENVALNLDMDSLQSNGFPAITHTGEGAKGRKGEGTKGRKGERVMNFEPYKWLKTECDMQTNNM